MHSGEIWYYPLEPTKTTFFWWQFNRKLSNIKTPTPMNLNVVLLWDILQKSWTVSSAFCFTFPRFCTVSQKHPWFESIHSCIFNAEQGPAWPPPHTWQQLFSLLRISEKILSANIYTKPHSSIANDLSRSDCLYTRSKFHDNAFLKFLFRSR